MKSIVNRFCVTLIAFIIGIISTASICSFKKITLVTNTCNLNNVQQNITNTQQKSTMEKDTSLYYKHIQPKHAEILKKWLKKYPGLRPATESDAEPSFLSQMHETNGKDYCPYYIVGDFNKDNYVDFAILLVDKQQTSEGGFTLVVFNGQANKDMYIAYYESNLRQIAISCIDVIDRELTLAKYETDTQCFSLIPKGKLYTFKDCSD